jgi:hypothetical protein
LEKCFLGSTNPECRAGKDDLGVTGKVESLGIVKYPIELTVLLGLKV